MASAALRLPVVATAWRIESIAEGRGDATAGTFRVTGTAQAGGAAVAWAAVAKALRPRGAPAADPAHWRAWQREALVYDFGIAAGVPGGFGPARCLRVELTAAGAWLWLEALTERAPRPWPAARLRLAARHLGRFQGAFAAGRPRPAAPWLPTRWLRDYVEACAPHVRRVAGAPDAPLTGRMWPEDTREEVLRMWAERERFLAALEALPQTLLHGDINLGNLFARRDARGAPVTTAIDWAFAAGGALGQDLVGLLRPRTQVREGLAPPALRALVFDGYLAGLRDAGWRGAADDVRLGLTGGAALRDLFHTLVYEILDEARRAEMEAQIRRPLESLADGMGRGVRTAVEYAREARALLGG